MGYPTTTQSSGQFSFGAFRQFWLSLSGPDYGTHLQGWCGQIYYSTAATANLNWPPNNMHLFLFYSTFPAGGGAGGGGGSGGK